MTTISPEDVTFDYGPATTNLAVRRILSATHAPTETTVIFDRRVTDEETALRLLRKEIEGIE